jgi:hypothetical protein
MNQRDRRALVAGTALLVGAAAVRAALSGIIKVTAARVEWARSLQYIDDARRELATLARLSDSVQVAESSFVGLAPRLLGAHTEADAHAELAAVLTSTASSSRLSMGAVVPRADSVATGRMRRVSVRTEFAADPTAFTSLLRGIGGGRPTVTVERVGIIASDPFAGRDIPQVLKVDLVCSAWYLASES